MQLPFRKSLIPLIRVMKCKMLWLRRQRGGEFRSPAGPFPGTRGEGKLTSLYPEAPRLAHEQQLSPSSWETECRGMRLSHCSLSSGNLREKLRSSIPSSSSPKPPWLQSQIQRRPSCALRPQSFWLADTIKSIHYSSFLKPRFSSSQRAKWLAGKISLYISVVLQQTFHFITSI